MATTNGVYECTGYGKDKTLCFICAVKIAQKLDPKEATICIRTKAYDEAQCAICKCFIHDRIEI